MPRHRATSQASFVVALLLIALFAGCAGTGAARPKTSPPAAGTDALWKEYCAAVATTQFPTAKHLSRGLVALVRSTPKLSWNDHGQILMATFTHQDCQKKPFTCPDNVGKSIPLTGQTWLSAVPFLRDFCRQVPPPELGIRLVQRLGMPPSSAGYYDVLVQLWVDPKDFFRPCADPEVTDGECELNLTTEASSGADCPWSGSYASQTSAQFVEVKKDHLDWMCTNWTGSYTPPCQPGTTNLPYPWTGLGYTWDWAPGNPSHQGESEFVVPGSQDKPVEVTVESVTPIAAYCK